MKPALRKRQAPLPPETVRTTIDRIAAQHGLKSPEDFYRLTSAMLATDGSGARLMSRHQSIGNLVMKAYPNHAWNPWQFERTPKGFWTEKSNRLRFIEWAAAKLNVKELPGWYKHSAGDIEKLGGNGVLAVYGESLYSALADCYPNHTWEPWRFMFSPKGFWTNPDNHRRFFNWLYTHLKLGSMDGWYSVTEPSLVEAGGAALLTNYFNNSIASALMATYPSHEWKPWRFNRLPPNYWVALGHRQKFFDDLGAKLKLKSLEEWYRVPNQAIIDHGGEALIKKRYNTSVALALMDTYLDHAWEPWRFMRFPKSLVDVARRQTSSSLRFYSAEKLSQMVVTSATKQLAMQSVDDWYNVSDYQLAMLGMGTAIRKLGGLEEVLKTVFPDHKFDQYRLQVRRKARNLIESIVHQRAEKLFPNADWKLQSTSAGLVNPANKEPLTIDVFSPKLRLGFEFQGIQHYKDISFAGQSATIKAMDSLKQNLARQAGIDVIAVPFWWDRKSESLGNTVRAVRPDLVPEPLGDGGAIPPSPPRKPIKLNQW